MRQPLFYICRMDVEMIRDYVLQKNNVTEGFPFGEDTLVFKVIGKMFLLISLSSSPLQFNVKCDPGEAEMLREQFPETVLPGYHMNKKHWNTILVNGSVSDKELFSWIDHSYELVSKKK